MISDLKSVPGLWDSNAIVISSEFGRTVRQNAPSASAGGTDHGWGNTQMVLGGAVRGKRVGVDPTLSDLERYNFIVPTISTFNPIIEVLS